MALRPQIEGGGVSVHGEAALPITIMSWGREAEEAEVLRASVSAFLQLHGRVLWFVGVLWFRFDELKKPSMLNPTSARLMDSGSTEVA